MIDPLDVNWTKFGLLLTFSGAADASQSHVIQARAGHPADASVPRSHPATRQNDDLSRLHCYSFFHFLIALVP